MRLTSWNYRCSFSLRPTFKSECTATAFKQPYLYLTRHNRQASQEIAMFYLSPSPLLTLTLRLFVILVNSIGRTCIRDRLRHCFRGKVCLQRAIETCFPLVCREQERRHSHGPTEVYPPAHSLVEDVSYRPAAAFGPRDCNRSPPSPCGSSQAVLGRCARSG